jgi:2'-5' RNA ligase
MGYNIGMRIFVGIPISEELKGRVLEWEEQHQFDLSVPPEAGHLPSPGEKGDTLRWIAGKNLHVTLVPPLDFARDLRPFDIEEIIGKLKVIKFEPFEIKFNRITFKPDEHRPRMIWATGEAGEEIKKLKKLIEISLGRKVDKTRGHEFCQHITLARLKSGVVSNHLPALRAGLLLKEGGDVPVFAKASAGKPQLSLDIDWRQMVTSFALYESRLLPDGADYTVLKEFRFAPSTKY